MAVRATVEALLRERKLDRTLTSAIPERLGEDAVAPLDVDALDRGLAGGLPRGHVSEVVGPASSGRTGLVWAALAAATRRGETVALVDTFDRFDPPTAAACGIVLPRLLWVRGQAVSKTAVAIDPAWLPGVRAVNGPGTFVERVIDRALKSLNLVVQSRVCTLVVIDLIDVPAQALRRLPAATWFRIERAIEGSDTAVVILAAQPVARSSGGRSIVMGADSRVSTSACAKATADKPDCRLPTADSRLPTPVWRGTHDRTRRLGGVRTTAAIGAARWSGSERVGVETRFVHAV
jgi:recombination protein RecA